MGPELVDRFYDSEKESTSIKVSQLKDYNDPYEFFLTIDYNQKPQKLAYYKEIISGATERFVSCFSKSPIITPMWAHYATNSTGFVLEFDEAALESWIDENTENPCCTFNDITYKDSPSQELLDLLDWAYGTQKFRHVAMLRYAIESTAYFSKQLCWSYEQERRMLISKSATYKISDNLNVVNVPAETITAIIAGASITTENQRKIENFAEAIGCAFYKKTIGKSSTKPFLIDQFGATHCFTGVEISNAKLRCESCKEPIATEKELCSWCQINEAHEYNAANRNSLRALHTVGLLGGYMSGFSNIRSKTKNDQGSSEN